MTMPGPMGLLQEALNRLAGRVRILESDDRSEVTGGWQTILFADLPAPGLFAGRSYYVSNGRKMGEGAGAGTGVCAYCDSTGWFRYSDDTPVAA